MSQRTYVPVSILPFSDSEVGSFFSKGQDNNYFRPSLFYFIQTGVGLNLVCRPVVGFPLL